MNLITFASVMLICSTAVLAFPDVGVPGGVNDADANSPEIKELAKKALAKSSIGAGSGCTQKVSRVISATKQVVAGMIHNLKLEVCTDTCADRAINTDECKLCSAQTYERAWENFFQVQDFKCD